MARDTYDQIFFEENYSRQMRERARTQESANSRANATDMPNATTVVFMEDTHDGGVTITTGDFVAYFNKQYGCDRVGNMRRSLAQAQRNCELKQTRARMEQAKEPKEKNARATRRSIRPRFSFVRAMFGMMFVLAMMLLVSTSLMLERGETELAQLKQEVAALEQCQSAEAVVKTNASVEEDTNPEMLSLDGENEVVLYPVEEESFVMSDLLNAFASIWE